jgi:hypothetical protein
VEHFQVTQLTTIEHLLLTELLELAYRHLQQTS